LPTKWAPSISGGARTVRSSVEQELKVSPISPRIIKNIHPIPRHFLIINVMPKRHARCEIICFLSLCLVVREENSNAWKGEFRDEIKTTLRSMLGQSALFG
jgi:hypothetical protein